MFDTSQSLTPYWNQGVTIIPGQPIPAAADPLQDSVHTTIIELMPGFLTEDQLTDVAFDGTIPPLVELEKFMKRIKSKEKHMASKT